MYRILFFIVFCRVIYGCTDFVIETKDRTFVNGRSLEFAMDLETQLKVFSRNTQLSSKSPSGQKGIEWVSKYGYLGATVFDSDLTLDGMNEEGLSFGYLWLPHSQYQKITVEESKKAVDFVDLGAWILGNFSTVAELKKALSQILVWGHLVPPLPGIPPVHVAVHDRLGYHLVIEFIEGEMKIYDNPNTVLTNYPPFDWQITNLENYIGLNALNAAPISLKGMNFDGVGQGSGFLGMPGDWTPPSRFIRISTLLRFVKTAADAKEGVNLVTHLLNTVDIPKGAVIARDGSQDYTQWIVIKDLTNRVFYFRTYQNLSLQLVDLKTIDFSPNAKKKPFSIKMI